MIMTINSCDGHAGDDSPNGSNHAISMAVALDSCPSIHSDIPGCGGYFLFCFTLQDQSTWLGSSSNCCPSSVLGIIYGAMKRYEFEVHRKVSVPWILGPSLGLVRVPGVGLVYTELAAGVPHIFSHFFTNLPALHSAVVFVCVKYFQSIQSWKREIPCKADWIGSKDFHIFRCAARYGYKDLHKKDDDFENKLFDSLFRFVRLESMMKGCSDLDEHSLDDELTRELRNGLSGYDGDELSSIVDETISSAGSMTVNSESQANNTILQSNQDIF